MFIKYCVLFSKNFQYLSFASTQKISKYIRRKPSEKQLLLASFGNSSSSTGPNWKLHVTQKTFEREEMEGVREEEERERGGRGRGREGGRGQGESSKYKGKMASIVADQSRRDTKLVGIMVLAFFGK